MKTNRVLAGVLALSLTAGGAVYVPEFSATAYAAETSSTNAMTKDNYAHNFDYTAWDVWTPDAYEHTVDPRLICPKENNYNDRVCVFSTISASSNSVNCLDVFYDKKDVEDDSFELMAETWGYEGHYRIFAKTKDHFNLGKIQYETFVVNNGDKGKELVGPRKADPYSSSYIYLSKNMTVYCHPDTKIYYYTSHNPYPYDELQRITDDKVGYFNRDGSITLLPDVIRLGDVNHDNVIDVEDTSIIVNHINGVKALDDKYIWAADVNGDGIVDIEDAVSINNQINGVASFEKELEKDNYKILSDSKKSDVSSTGRPVTSVTAAPKASASPSSAKTSDILGDVNGDGKIDISDLSKLAIALVDKEELPEDFVKRADVDKDGKITLTDLAAIRQFIAKKITEF